MAARMSAMLPSFARANSSRRFTMATELFLAKATAFSMAASPAPTTTIDSPLYSSGSSSWYCTNSASSPGAPSLRDSLHPDAQDDRLRLNHLVRFEGKADSFSPSIALTPAPRHVDAMLFQGVGPAVEDDFPRALLEGHGAARATRWARP